ncbi:putative CbiA domain-containing protein [Brevibacillus sp. IT-7CA2]|uniref:hypothetical protein n=1 Tax=Brevibacillus sp. IT-7CA2 TaxID=3026436 RepID=UPI0039E02B84
MRIAMICTPIVYDKIKTLFYRFDIKDLELSEPLPDFDQAVEYLRKGVTGIILQESTSASDIIKTIGIPYLIYEGQKEFGSELERWLQSLSISFTPAKGSNESHKRDLDHKTYQEELGEEQKQENESVLPAHSPLSLEAESKEPPASNENYSNKAKEKVADVIASAKELGKNSMEQLIGSVHKKFSSKETPSHIPSQQGDEPAPVYKSQLEQECLVLYSPESTGKTFIGVNLSIALGLLGKKVQYMDDTGRVKHWFNAPVFPFQLEGIDLTVSGLERTSQAEILVVETRRVEVLSFLQPHKLFLVLDSDLAHQIEVAKAIRDLQPIGMIWNQESQFGDPSKLIHLPVVVTLPRYSDTYERIEKGVPRALSDEVLRQELLKIWQFDSTGYFMNGGIVS